MKEMYFFIWNEFNIKDILSGKLDLIEVFNKFFCVCGVVKNIGVFGGGFFWVKDDNGNILF